MSKGFKVLVYGEDDRLREVCKPVEVVTDEIREYVEKMKITLKEYKGVGLAASQVGILDRLILVCYESGRNGYTEPVVMVNPKLVSFSEKKVLSDEGCLSIPGRYGDVYRHKKITVEYTDLDGVKHKVKQQDFNAFVIQHEIDHLDGIMFIDKEEKN